MRRWIRITALMLIMAVLAGIPVATAKEPKWDLEGVMEDFIAENGLNEENFSLSYYNTVTGEAYAFNDKAFMVAASTYKLPLNMYYYELERDGLIEPDAYIPRAGTTLDVAHRESLVHSNNDLSIGLLYNLGDFSTYKTLMRKYFTMPEEEIEPVYYSINHYCVNMMMDALKYLYANSEDFEEMLGYMKQAQPDEYFRAGVTEYEVAHKYGWYDGAVNDVGIIYTEEPFLLAVYTQGIYGERVLADVAALLTEYNVANTTPAEPEVPEEELPAEFPLEEGVTLEVEMVPLATPEEAEPEEEATAVMATVEENPPAEVPDAAQQTETEDAFEWWMVAVALGIFVLGGGGLTLALNPKRLQKKYETKYEERMKK